MKIKRFNFKKKPAKPILFWLAKGIISFPDLKKRKAKITKIGMEEIKDKPYLLLANHASLVDLNLMLKATHPYPCINVMSLEGFNTYTYPLMRALGVLGKRKFIQDINLIRNIRYTVNKLKIPFVLFPEARYSLDGCGSYIPPSLASLAKSLKVPVVMLRIRGNFVTSPQWNKKNKGIYVEAEMERILTPEQLSLLSDEEIFKILKDNFTYDDYKWQYDNKIVIDDPDRANGLHALLYKCPHCLAEGKMQSGGTRLWCEECGKVWEQDIYGRLSALEGETEFAHIPDWSNWERACVREEIRNGTYYFEDEIRLETLPGWTKFYKHGKGRIIQTPEGTVIECENLYKGGPFKLEKSPFDLDSVHIEYDYLGRGDCIDISVSDDSFWCYVTKKDIITKFSFATEEIHALALEKRGGDKRKRPPRKTKEAEQ